MSNTTDLTEAVEKVLDAQADIVRQAVRDEHVKIAFSFCPFFEAHGEQCRSITCTACAIATQIGYPAADVKRARREAR